MVAFNYDVITSSNYYHVKKDFHRTFKEKLSQKDAPRPAWEEMLKIVEDASDRAQRVAKINKRINAQSKTPYLSESPEMILVNITSLEALQAPSEKVFKQLIGQAIDCGATIHSLKEDVVFSKEFPDGIYDPDSLEFSNSMEKLRKEWAKTPPVNKTNINQALITEEVKKRRIYKI